MVSIWCVKQKFDRNTITVSTSQEDLISQKSNRLHLHSIWSTSCCGKFWVFLDTEIKKKVWFNADKWILRIWKEMFSSQNLIKTVTRISMLFLNSANMKLSAVLIALIFMWCVNNSEQSVLFLSGSLCSLTVTCLLQELQFLQPTFQAEGMLHAPTPTSSHSHIHLYHIRKH